MRKIALCLAALVLAGCALRPRYGQFVGKETRAPVRLQLLEKQSGLPVSGAVIEVGDNRKVTFKTDEHGVFTLPVDPLLLSDNALIVVTAPRGVSRTQLVPVPAPELPMTRPQPVFEVVDGGTSTY